MKVRFLATVAVVMFLSAMASAQGTMSVGGISVDVTLDGWVIVNEATEAVAMHEAGCLMYLGAIPPDQVEATIADIDATLDFLTVTAIDGGLDEEGNMAFAGMGVIDETGEAVEFILVGGLDEATGLYALLFAGASTGAACQADMVAFIGTL